MQLSKNQLINVLKNVFVKSGANLLIIVIVTNLIAMNSADCMMYMKVKELNFIQVDH